MRNLQQSIKILDHDFFFTDFPRYASVDVYDTARRWFVDRLSTCSNIVSIYEAGKVSSPGISDLDFLVVLSDAFSEQDSDVFDESDWPEELVRLIGGGTILKTSTALFPELAKIDRFQLIHLYGTVLQEYETVENMPFLNLCRLIDWLPERVMTLTWILTARRIYLMRQLGLLKSISMSFSLFVNECNIMNDICDSFAHDINNLREGWFTDNTNSHMQWVIEYSLQAISIGLKMLKHLAYYVEKAELIARAGVDNAMFRLNASLCFRFLKDFNLCDPIRLIRDTDLSRFALIVPATFYPYFAYQSLCEGIISQRIRKSIWPTPSRSCVGYLDKELQQTIRERMSVCNRNALFLEERSITSGLLKYGWFLKRERAVSA